MKLKRLAALEGMTMFELMDKITTSVVAECEENGYDLTPVDRRSSKLKIHAEREGHERK